MEIFVLDNGSRDESPTLDTEFPNVTVLRMAKNFGWTKSMNIGLRSAAADFILFLDAHVEVRPGTVRLLAAQLEADSEAAASTPLLTTPEGETVATAGALPSPADPDPVPAVPQPGDGVIPVECPGNRALLVRKNFLQGMNFIDQRYGQFWGDVEICHQVRNAARKCVLVGKAHATLYPGASGPWTNPCYSVDYELGRAAYFGKHYGFLTGLSWRVKSIMGAFIRLQFSRLNLLISGQKIDGTQVDA